MRRWHVSAPVALLLVCGCGPADPDDEVLPIAAHLAPGCRETTQSLVVQLEALGDFDASATTSEALPGDARGVEVGFPASTRAVEMLAEGTRGRFWGEGDRSTAGRFDVVLWSRTDSCRAWSPSDAAGTPYPGATGGESLGRSADGRFALIAGGLTNSADSARAVLIQLDNGVTEEVEGGLLPNRAFATVTPFGDLGFLVAGGSNPTLSGSDLSLSPPIDSAIPFSLTTRRFDTNGLIALSVPRTHHGATLLASGETLLVGGTGPTGVALSTLEAISPTDHAARVAGLATLKRPRTSPQVVPLSDGRILVAGGRGVTGAPETSVEWLSADASAVAMTRTTLVTSNAPAFVAVEGGGALGVGVCSPSHDDCSTPEASVTFLRADGSFDALPDLLDPEAPLLLAGSNGAPWLAAGAGSRRSWRQYDPWSGRFVQPTETPDRVPTGALPALAFDSGSFGFLLQEGAGAAIEGFRHDTRNEYTRTVAPLLVTSAEHLAPDRAPGSEIRFDSSGLHLAGNAATAWVTDVRFADLRIALELGSGSAPRIVLGNVVVGSSSCPWPEAVEVKLTVTRAGDSIELRRGSARTTCAGPQGRVAVGLRASGNESIIRSLALHRTL
ncbi:MAG: hypothetical protein R3B13_20780 [Polyangiaceae bacterium]